jgi:hypothetical protein
MSIRIEYYLIYGLKFDEEFTNDYWEKEFYNNEEWNKNKPLDKPFFITDGMTGDYTFFGFKNELSNGWDDPKEQEINLEYLNNNNNNNNNNNKKEIIQKFNRLYPDIEIKEEQIKMYFLPHWV